MKFELFVAARYLRAKRRQAFIGIITGISVAGVAAGVAALIIALAITNGFRQDLQDRLIGSTSHVDLMRIKDDGIKDWRALIERLAKQPHVVGAAPGIYDQVLISRGPRARGADLKGIIPSDERKVSDLLASIKYGSAKELDPGPAKPMASTVAIKQKNAHTDPAENSPDDLQAVKRRLAAMPPVVLGKDLADALEATVGSEVLVTSPQGELTPLGIVPKYVRFRVVGIFDSGFFDYDNTWAFTRLTDAQDLEGVGDQATVIEFKIDDINKAPAVGDQLEQAAGQGFMTTNWMQQNQALFHALNMERLVTFVTIGLIVFVAALNILIALIMMVMEKTRDIAVLMSMGAKKSQIRRIFIAQGVLIGVVGTVLGLILGFTLSWIGGRYHMFPLSAEVYSIDYVPFAPHLIDGVWVSAIALGVSLLATVYPSWSASRILPAETLRYE